MSHQTVTQVFAAMCPWLALMWCLQRMAAGLRLQLRGWALLTLSALIAAAMLLVPIQGLAASRWVAGLNANFSIPLTGMLAVGVHGRAFGRQVFSERDWMAGWSFGGLGSLTLYPFALGAGGFDPYEWGWRFSPLFALVAMLSGWLIWNRNRFGLLLLAAVIAFHLRVLESSNYWDYLLDPFYGLASVGALVRRALSARSRLRPEPEAL